MNHSKSAVFVTSDSLDQAERAVRVQGTDFNQTRDIGQMLREDYPRMGFQASAFGDAIHLIDQMVKKLHSVYLLSLFITILLSL